MLLQCTFWQNYQKQAFHISNSVQNGHSLIKIWLISYVTFSIEEKVWSVKKEINNMAAVKLSQLNLDIDPTSLI